MVVIEIIHIIYSLEQCLLVKIQASNPTLLSREVDYCGICFLCHSYRSISVITEI